MPSLRPTPPPGRRQARPRSRALATAWYGARRRPLSRRHRPPGRSAGTGDPVPPIRVGRPDLRLGGAASAERSWCGHPCSGPSGGRGARACQACASPRAAPASRRHGPRSGRNLAGPSPHSVRKSRESRGVPPARTSPCLRADPALDQTRRPDAARDGRCFPLRHALARSMRRKAREQPLRRPRQPSAVSVVIAGIVRSQSFRHIDVFGTHQPPRAVSRNEVIRHIATGSLSFAPKPHYKTVKVSLAGIIRGRAELRKRLDVFV